MKIERQVNLPPLPPIVAQPARLPDRPTARSRTSPAPRPQFARLPHLPIHPPCPNPSQVLLLDEITVDLDVVARLRLLDFFRDECEERGATILYATHIFDGALWGAGDSCGGLGAVKGDGDEREEQSANILYAPHIFDSALWWAQWRLSGPKYECEEWGATILYAARIFNGAFWRLGTRCVLGAVGWGLGTVKGVGGHRGLLGAA